MFVKYEVQETLKGKKQNEGEVTDLAGIGTGFVNFIPGTYHIIALSEKPEELDKNQINFCDVLGMALHLGDEELQQKIVKLKTLSKNP